MSYPCSYQKQLKNTPLNADGQSTLGHSLTIAEYGAHPESGCEYKGPIKGSKGCYTIELRYPSKEYVSGEFALPLHEKMIGEKNKKGCD